MTSSGVISFALLYGCFFSLQNIASDLAARSPFKSLDQTVIQLLLAKKNKKKVFKYKNFLKSMKHCQKSPLSFILARRF